MTKNMSSREYLKICRKCRCRIHAYGDLVYDLVCCVYKSHLDKVFSFYDMEDAETRRTICPVVRFIERKGIVITKEDYDFPGIVRIELVERVKMGESGPYLCWC